MEQEAKRHDGKDGGRNEEKWVNDSSVNKGKVPLRASTGVWKASLLIITIVFNERLSYFGIAANLISYLINVLHEDLKTDAKNVNYWTGVTPIPPLAGEFLADAYLGRFKMVLLSSLIYLMGLCLLTMSQFIPVTKPCNLGKCHKPRRIHEGTVTVIVYVQNKVSWGVADLSLTIVIAVTILTFYIGKIYYRYRLPEALTPLLQVLVAAIRKRKLLILLILLYYMKNQS